VNKLLLCSVVLVLPFAMHAQPAASVESRIAAQNTIFDDWYEQNLRDNPLAATAYGDYRYNDQLDDESAAAYAKINQQNKAFLARLVAVNTNGMPEQDWLSHEIMLRRLRQSIESYELKNYEMSVNQQIGIHITLSDLPNQVPLDSVKHYDDYIARLHQIPRVLAETTEVLRQGMADHLMPPRFVLEKVATQAQGIADSKPFLTPVGKIPTSFSAADRQRITAAIHQATDNEVSPAFARFAEFISKEYAPHGRADISIASLPDGQHRYEVAVRNMTTTNLTPEQIHQLGLEEVKRIHAEMNELAHRAGFKDLASFKQSLQTNPKYKPASSEQILGDFRHYIDQMRPKLAELFTVLPDCPVTVEAIPPYQAGTATHYQTGTPDCKRPGRVSVATSDFQHRTMINDEAIAYHEGIPGHHMQLSVQQQLNGLPRFRLHGTGGMNAFVEGWALYSEQLGKDIGFYQDPVSDYGRLSSELFRAVRLVVDTGIHSKGWTRDQVIQYFRENSSEDEPNIQAETDRYIAWPAQALSYKLGQLKFRELRERAQRELGPTFDLRRFHDEMLSGGAMPLDLLDMRTNRWIAGQKPAVASAEPAPLIR